MFWSWSLKILFESKRRPQRSTKLHCEIEGFLVGHTCSFPRSFWQIWNFWCCSTATVNRNEFKVRVESSIRFRTFGLLYHLNFQIIGGGSSFNFKKSLQLRTKITNSSKIIWLSPSIIWLPSEESKTYYW